MLLSGEFYVSLSVLMPLKYNLVAGVRGCLKPGSLVQPLFCWAQPTLDKLFGVYISVHIQEAYKFIMDEYNPGDKICLFGTFGSHYSAGKQLTISSFVGFSRGAYAVRALASMLSKVFDSIPPSPQC